MMDKENVAHIYSGVLFTIKNEIMPLVGKWMKLEILMLNMISQAQKPKYCMILFLCEI
jgi:hypothetical protein